MVLMGESNEVGRGTPLDSGIDVSGGSVFQWGQNSPNNGLVIVANEPLDHINKTNVGHSLAFARDYYVPNQLAAGRNVLLVPCAQGGTNISTHWKPGATEYELAVTRANAAIADTVGNTAVLAIITIGHNDAGLSQSTMQTAMMTLVSDFRSRVTGASALRFVFVGLVPVWVSGSGARALISAAVANMPNIMSNCGYADPSSPTVLGPNDPDTDAIHYSAASQRSLGERIWTVCSQRGRNFGLQF